MEVFLSSRIRCSLELFCYSNAVFLAERLLAGFPSEANKLLLAHCYYCARQPQQAYYILKGSKSGQCRYLLALVCLELELFAEAESALLPQNTSTSEALTNVPNGAAGLYLLGLICRRTDRRHAAIEHFTAAVTLDPFLWCAYEELCRLGAEDEAVQVHGDAAEKAVEELFSRRSYPGAGTLGGGDVSSAQARQEEENQPPSSPQHMRAPLSVGATLGASAALHPPLSGSPSPYTTPPFSTLQVSYPPGKAGQRSEVNPPGEQQEAGTDPSPPLGTPGASPAGGRRKFVDEGKLRKVAGRLFAEPGGLRRSSRLAESTSTGLLGRSSGSGAGQSRLTRPSERWVATSAERPRHLGLRKGGDSAVPGGTILRFEEAGLQRADWPGELPTETSGPGRSNRGNALLRSAAGRNSQTPRTAVTTAAAPGGHAGQDDNAELLSADAGEEEGAMGHDGPLREGTSSWPRQGAHELLALLRKLGTAFRLLCLLRCQEAVEVLQQLSPQQYTTAWVLVQIGRAHYEMVDYVEAERAFSWARRIAPHRVESLDIYSSVLYHLKREVDLSHLAQDALATDRLAPEAWCVMGNCMSVHAEHEAALKFFKRALQLDPNYTYAHTLCGHEHMALEQFEEGMACYRAALRLDSRHYNAWYGLGNIYLRQESPKLAEYHFRRALQINSRSSVLHCYLGMALHALKRNSEALEELQKAASWDGRNPLPLYERAAVLLAEGRLQEAMEQAQELAQMAAREASVYFLLARVYAKLEQPEKAMLHLNIALDLKPSAAETNNIKAAMEKLHVPDQLEEEYGPADENLQAPVSGGQ